MAKKPHKYADNGVALDTALSIADLKAICARAAVESTGDLWNGQYKILEAESGETWIRYQIPGALRLLKLMVFSVKMTSDGARSTLETEIEDYYTTQTTVMYFIPVTPKKMVTRHSYVQFINKVANTVRQADPSARIAISEGERTPAPRLPAATGYIALAAAEAPAPTVVTSGPPAPQTELAPPPPPPPPTAVAIEPVPMAAVMPAAIPVAVDQAGADERTQKIQRRARSPRWLVSPHGMTPVPLVTPIVVGRAPIDESNSGAYLLAVPRTEDTVSKSHARLELVDGAILITDLGSINGTVLVGADEKIIDCDPQVATPVPAGYTIELGDFLLTVEPEGGTR
jgi:hypothetical protein